MTARLGAWLERAAEWVPLDFLWPEMLWLLALLLPTAAFALRRVGRSAAPPARLPGLVIVAPGDVGALRRYLPVVTLMLALAVLLLAVARPQAVVRLPARTDTIMLAMDISGSMRADDVKPSRIRAAQDAARRFVEAQPEPVRIGVVAVAGSAAVLLPPTRNREDALQAIERVQLQRGTALGSGIAIALATALPEAGIDAGLLINGRSTRTPVPGTAGKPPARKDTVPGQAAIVLISDGDSNTGPDPLDVAKVAADHGVRVYTVGIGTPDGVPLTLSGWTVRVHLEETALKKIATATGAEYHRAGNPDDLRRIYERLTARLTMSVPQKTEVSALFAGAGMVLATLGALLSLLWFNRIA